MTVPRHRGAGPRKLAAASAVLGAGLFAASFFPLFPGQGPVFFGLAVAAQLAVAVVITSTGRSTPAAVPAGDPEVAELRRRLEASLAEAEAKAKEQERFTYIVSHDLRSPLLTMQGFSDILKLDLEEKNFEAVDEDLEHILKATQRMRLLLDDLLELSRIGRFNEPAVDAPVAEIVADALYEIRELVESRGARIDVAEVLPTLRVDRARIQQLFRILLDNAVRYGGEGRPPRVRVGVVPGTEPPELFVADDGAGLEPEQLVSAFRPFERFSAESVGSGMGLAHAQRIVEYHRGSIRAESAGKDQGATVFFTLREPAEDGES